MKQKKAPHQPWLRLLATMCALPVAVQLTASAQSTPPAPATPPAEKPATPPAEETSDDILILSPFTVDAKKDKGYFAENTLAGSRMNTKLSDLGASISVVNKAQMQDFASRDVNDIFRYEVNTEGSGTYTPMTFSQRGDGVLDVNAGGTLGGTVASFTNAGANRVRGLGVPSPAINYYQVRGYTQGVPADSYNVDSFEISRGPNSMLFGMGSPAGIVNETTTQAKVNVNSDSLEISMDDRGSFRSSLGFNHTLVKDKLAIYGGLLYNNQQFERKPSYDITRRQYVALTYKPFKKTTITANYEHYSNSNRRPNTLSPIDYITQWNLAGRPTYDALTKRITLLSTGQTTVAPYISSASSTANAVANAAQVRAYILSLPGYNPNLKNTQAVDATHPMSSAIADNAFTWYNNYNLFGLTALNPSITAAQPNPYADPLYVPGMAEVNQGRAVMQILNGRLINWNLPFYSQTYRSGYNNPAGGNEHTFPIDTFSSATTTATTTALWLNSTWSDVYNRDMYNSTGWTNNSFVTNVGSYKYPAITDRSIYDWKKVNINQINFGSVKNENYNIDFQQQITPDLFLSGGWLRQDFKQKTNYSLGQLNAPTVRIDENRYLTNGQANPFFGLPFVMDIDPDQFVNEEIDDHFRAMFAYTPDFTKKDGWMKWLGHHQILGLWSRDDSMQLARRKRLFYTGAGSQSATYRFLPNPNNGAVTSTSGPNGETGWGYGGATQRFFYLANPGDQMGKITRSSGPWDAESFNGNVQVYNYSASSFEDANVTEEYRTFDAPTRNQTIINSLSGGMTNYFWKDRLITTFGARLDKVKVRNTSTGAIVNADGTVTPTMTAYQKFGADGFFDDASMWNRFNPWARYTGRTRTGGGVLRPFSGWSNIDNRAAGGNQFWQIVQSFGISYNWSNNFDAPTRAEVDAFGTPLKNPSGIGRDVGLQFSALDGKLFARVTWFKASNINQRNTSDIALTRLINNVDTTIYRDWARRISAMNLGLDPAVAVPAVSEQAVQAGAEAAWGMPYNYYGSLPGSVVPTQDQTAKGVEVQVNYNTGNWRNRFTFGKQETITSNGMTQYDAWYAVRVPRMMTATAATFLNATALATAQANGVTAGRPGRLGYSTNAASPTTSFVDLTEFWNGYGFGGISQNDQFGSISPGAYYANNVTGNATLSKSLNGQAAPGQRKYRWAYNTGYDFTTRLLKGFGVGGAERWEARSVIGYYGKPGYTTAGTAAYNPDLLDVADVGRPIYDKANYYTDLFIRYKRKVWNDRIAWTIQLNVENVRENGRLQVVGVNYDGSPYAYRIIDSRKFTLTSTFEF